MRRSLRRRIRTFGRDERGAELIEFGLVSIFVLILMFGIMEFGRGIWIYGSVAHLAREGARWSIVRGSESPRTTTPTEVETYVNSVAAGMTGLTVTTTWDDPLKDPGNRRAGSSRQAVYPRGANGGAGQHHAVEHIADGDRLLEEL